MKKLILLFALLLCSTVSLFAQNYKEVVYLKNGSIIRGVIIEQVPNVSLKIQTQDGSLFVCQISEIEKITKEIQDNRRSSRSSFDLGESTYNQTRGYKGFVETGYSFGLDDHTTNRIELSTSHGYQFNPYLFLGAGLGVSYFSEVNEAAVPLFADFRVNFTKKPSTPFANVQFGYANGDIDGIYLSTSVGMRFELPAKKALNLKLSFTLQNNEYTYGFNGHYFSDTESLNAVGLKLGFEF